MIDLPPLVPVQEGLAVISTIKLVPPADIGHMLAHSMLYRPYAWARELPNRTEGERIVTARRCAEFMISEGRLPHMTEEFLENWLVNGMIHQMSGHSVVEINRLDCETGKRALDALLEGVRDGIISEHGNSRDFSHFIHRPMLS